MTIKRFIEAAIEGGWKERLRTPSYTAHEGYVFSGVDQRRIYLHEILLDPEAWKAVGKVKGWNEDAVPFYASALMLDLFQGKTIEEYLATL